MCIGLMEYAHVNNIANTSEPSNISCAVNSRCDGIRCDVQLSYGLYYDEVIILPCTNPPAVEYLLETSDYTPIMQLIFDDSGTYIVESAYVANLTYVVKSFITRGPRSVSVEVCQCCVGNVTLYGSGHV